MLAGAPCRAGPYTAFFRFFKWRVNLDDALMKSMNEWLRLENVEVLYP
jgi:hypothetical protein